MVRPGYWSRPTSRSNWRMPSCGPSSRRCASNWRAPAAGWRTKRAESRRNSRASPPSTNASYACRRERWVAMPPLVFRPPDARPELESGGTSVRIAINAALAGPEATGIGTYASSLVRALPRADGGAHEYEVFVGDRLPDEGAVDARLRQHVLARGST